LRSAPKRTAFLPALAIAPMSKLPATHFVLLARPPPFQGEEGVAPRAHKKNANDAAHGRALHQSRALRFGRWRRACDSAVCRFRQFYFRRA
jgi:hypothetical protein